MRASLFIGSSVLAAAAAVACAATDANGTPPSADPSPEASLAPVAEGGMPDVDAGADASPGLRTCSDDGWCLTSLPDPDLIMRDVWPLAGRAFAVAESPTLGVRFLEWVDADAKWTYIDDSTQNEDGRGRWAGKVWAPSENEVYFGVSPNYVFHGTRTAPGTPWSWTNNALGTAVGIDIKVSYLDLPAEARPLSLGIWGTSSSDVYAWYQNRIYHWTSVDGGAPAWIPEFVAGDMATGEQIHFITAAGAGPDEVWFAGGRVKLFNGCAVLVRRTTMGFERIADGTPSGRTPLTCTARPGAILIGGALGWLTDLHAISENELIGLKGTRDVLRISREADSYSFAFSPIPAGVQGVAQVYSLSPVADGLWMGGDRMIVRGDGSRDGGAYELSLISMNGAALVTPIVQVRGTSNTNLWAMGSRYALHKTTP